MRCFGSGWRQPAGGTRFTVPFDRQQMADCLNPGRSALSGEPGRMRDEGLLRLRKDELEPPGTALWAELRRVCQ